MKKGDRTIPTITHLPSEVLCVIFGFLEATNLLACRKVCRQWRDIFFSHKIWKTIPPPKHSYRGRLIWHMDSSHYASFLTSFDQLDLSSNNLPPDYVHEITKALDTRSRLLTMLDLSATNLQALSYDNLKIYLKSSSNITLVRCKLNDLQLKHMCQIIDTTRIQNLDLRFVNLRKIPSIILRDGLGKIKDLTVSKHYILRSQLEAILMYHVEIHQEWLFNLENEYPYFYHSSNQILQPSQVTSKYFDITLKELYVQIPHNAKHDIICGQCNYTIECKDHLHRRWDYSCSIKLM